MGVSGAATGVVFGLSFKSERGRSVYEDLAGLCGATFNEYRPRSGAIAEAERWLRGAGCVTQASSEVGLTMSCSQPTFERIFTTQVAYERIRLIRDYEKYVFISKTAISVPRPLDQVERVFLPKQSFELIATETARPHLDYRHLNVPDDIRSVAQVQDLHDRLFTGRGVTVVMVDTGLYSHAYYREQGISFEKIAAVSSFDVEDDERGHGTAMSSVLLSVAPGVNYVMVKACDAVHSYPVAAFQKAVAQEPDVINCSWGTIGLEPQLYLEIANAIDRGIVVVFSSGNGSTDRKSAFFQSISYPDAVIVGGCYPADDGTLEVSDISSGYESDLFSGRDVPDVCGLCGKLPKAQLILLPTRPGGVFDVANGSRDGTGREDGWMVSSGTSAAAAHVSGLIALLLQAHPRVDRRRIKDLLAQYCVPVNRGVNAMGLPATLADDDRSTGSGFLTGVCRERAAGEPRELPGGHTHAEA